MSRPPHAILLGLALLAAAAAGDPCRAQESPPAPETLRQRQQSLAKRTVELERQVQTVLDEVRAQGTGADGVEQEARLQGSLDALRSQPLHTMFEEADRAFRDQRWYDVAEAHRKLGAVLEEVTQTLEGRLARPMPPARPESVFRELKHLEGMTAARRRQIEELTGPSRDPRERDLQKTLTEDWRLSQELLERQQRDRPPTQTERQALSRAIDTQRGRIEQLPPASSSEEQNARREWLAAWNAMDETWRRSPSDEEFGNAEAALEKQRWAELQARPPDELTPAQEHRLRQTAREMALDAERLKNIPGAFDEQSPRAEQLRAAWQDLQAATQALEHDRAMLADERLHRLQERLRRLSGDAGVDLYRARLLAARDWARTMIEIFESWRAMIDDWAASQEAGNGDDAEETARWLRDAQRCQEVAHEQQPRLGPVLADLARFVADDAGRAARARFAGAPDTPRWLACAHAKLDALLLSFTRFQDECKQRADAPPEQQPEQIPGAWWYLDGAWGADHGFVPPWIAMTAFRHWRVSRAALDADMVRWPQDGDLIERIRESLHEEEEALVVGFETLVRITEAKGTP